MELKFDQELLDAFLGTDAYIERTTYKKHVTALIKEIEALQTKQNNLIANLRAEIYENVNHDHDEDH